MKWNKEPQVQTQSLESLIQHDIPKTKTQYPRRKVENEDFGSSRRISWRKFRLLGENWWLQEILAWIASFVFIAAILGVLLGYDQRPLPEWPYSITLNTLLSLLAQLAKAFLLVPIVSALGQIKWNWFAGGQRPLGSLGAFGGASAGLWGGFQLLYTLRGRWLGSLGAVLTILILGLEIFTQQAVAYSSRQIESDPAMIPVGSDYGTWRGFGGGDQVYMVPAVAMNAAMMNVVVGDLFGAIGVIWATSDTLPYSCPSGNCSYPTYSTLAVCSECADLSPLGALVCVEQESGQPIECQWTIPTDQVSVQFYNQTIQSEGGDDMSKGQYNLTVMPTSRSTNFKDIGSYIIAFSVASASIHSDEWIATECVLFWCVQTLNTTIKQGIRSEEVLSYVYNTTNNAPIILSGEPAQAPNDSSYGPLINGTYAQNIQILPANVSASGLNGNSTFSVDPLANYTIFNMFADWLAPSSLNTSGTVYSWFNSTGILNLTISQYYYHPNSSNGSSICFTMSSMISALASGLTDAVRLTATPDWIQGTSWTNEIYVHVRWKWLLFPMLLDFLALFFLLAVMATTTRSNTQIWKSDPLALIFHGLDHGTQIEAGDRRTISEMREIAEKLPVKLVQTRNGSKLSMQVEGI